jgi:hypothetical protein
MIKEQKSIEHDFLDMTEEELEKEMIRLKKNEFYHFLGFLTLFISVLIIFTVCYALKLY